MRTRLPIFALAIVLAAAIGWAAAQRGAESEQTPATSAQPTRYSATNQASRDEPAGEVVVPNIDALLRQAVAQLSATGSIEAKVRQRIDLFDRELIGSGTYAQQGAGLATRLRLEMRMRADESAMDLLQVANGETLWTFNAADGLRTLRRVDVDRVQDALRGESSDARAASMPTGTIGLGGLSWVLDGLRQYCEFKEVQTSKLGELEVFVVHGRWRTEKLLSLVPEAERRRMAAGGAIDATKLPQHLGDRVTIFLGRDDLFPYRFDYRRTLPPDQDGAEGSGASATADKATATDSSPSAVGTKPVMTLEFYEVRFGRNLPREMFAYKPGQGAIDDTDRYIERMTAKDSPRH